jgi:hypothetical protein
MARHARSATAWVTVTQVPFDLARWRIVAGATSPTIGAGGDPSSGLGINHHYLYVVLARVTKGEAMLIDRPMEHPGTKAEKSANRSTHYFNYDEGRCDYCDCRPWGFIADWPCGADVPRVTVRV